MSEQMFKQASGKPYQLFWRSVVRDALLVGVSTWLFLLVLESLKPGIASNYLSLTRFALGLFFLTIIHLALSPAQPNMLQPFTFTRRDIMVLIVMSFLSVGFLLAVMPSFNLLTLLVISVTVLAIWIGSFLYAET